MSIDALCILEGRRAPPWVKIKLGSKLRATVRGRNPFGVDIWAYGRHMWGSEKCGPIKTCHWQTDLQGDYDRYLTWLGYTLCNIGSSESGRPTMARESEKIYWMGAEASVKGGGLFKVIFEYVKRDSSREWRMFKRSCQAMRRQIKCNFSCSYMLLIYYSFEPSKWSRRSASSSQRWNSFSRNDLRDPMRLSISWRCRITSLKLVIVLERSSALAILCNPGWFEGLYVKQGTYLL